MLESAAKKWVWTLWMWFSVVFCLAWVWLLVVAVALWATGRSGALECAAVAVTHFVGMTIAGWGTE